MKESKDILTSVLHTAHMGRSGIQAVMDRASDPGLQELMKQQLQQYHMIQTEAEDLASSKGWQLPGRNILLEKMSNTCAKCRLLTGDKNSSIAGMLIQGNTRGMILGIKNLNQSTNLDPAVDHLANKLLNLENINIQKSQEFL